MADTNSGHATQIKQTSLDSNQFGQTQNIITEQKSNYGTTTQADLGAQGDSEAIKDQIDGAVAKGPKRADESTGGRVQVGETGDLHDLAARRQP